MYTIHTYTYGVAFKRLPVEKTTHWMKRLPVEKTEPQRQRVACRPTEGCIRCAPSDSRVAARMAPRIWSCSVWRAARPLRAYTSSTCAKTTSTYGSPRRAAATRSSWCPTRIRSVRVHRLRGDRLEELARTWSFQLNSCGSLMDSSWPIMTTRKSHAIIELEVSDTRLQRRRGPRRRFVSFIVSITYHLQ